MPRDDGDDVDDGRAGGYAVLAAAVQVLVSVELDQCGWDGLEAAANAAARLRGFVSASDARIARRREELVTAAYAGPGREDDPGSPASSAGSEPSGRPGGVGHGVGAGAGAGAGAGLGLGSHDDSSTSGGPGAGGGGSTRPRCGAGDAGRRSRADSVRDGMRGRAGRSFPAFEAALASGEIDAAHLDAVAVAMERLRDHADAAEAMRAEEARLLERARIEAPEPFRRHCLDLSRRLCHDHGIALAQRQRRQASIRRWRDRRTGMYHLHAELDPESGAQVEAALDAHLAAARARDGSRDLTWQRLEVESFVEVVTSSAAIERRVPEVSVLIDLETLQTGVFGDGAVCETSSGDPIPPATVRRMACTAGILPIVLDGESQVLDVGRSRRLATGSQRAALRAMYRTCAHPHCELRVERCRIHHLTPWEHGGPTDLDQLVPLCERHHHDVHEGGWTLTMNADRVTRWWSPSGHDWFVGDTRDRPPPVPPPAPEPEPNTLAVA